MASCTVAALLAAGPALAQTSGGGGGAGATGGNGGSDGGGFASGLGGSSPGAAGGVGGDNLYGGGGGGGGAHGAVLTVSTSNSGNVTGGAGGAGGAGLHGGFGDNEGGGGGGGGYGVVVNGSGLTYTNTNSGSIAGGGGGAGGTSQDGFAGGGGGGGYGIDFTGSGTLTNSGSIAGGAGGAGGAGLSSGSDGVGGVGVIGGNLTITDSGTIAGGLGGDGVTRANAITFTGGTNTLTLQPGYSITGNVVAFSAADTLALGGSGNASFNLSNIGSSAQYQGFGVFQKIGTSTWTLTGTTATTTNWTISGGTLEVGDAADSTTTVNGNMTVDAAGTLSGHGTVSGTVTNTAGGIVAPGGSIGTLSVGGNYTQGSSSTLSIEVSPTAASKLDVTGTAALAGTLKLVYDPGVYSQKTYDILHAGSVSGSFATVSGTAPTGFTQALSYSTTDVDLALDPVVVAPTHDTVFSALSTAALQGAQAANDTVLGRLAALQDGSGDETPEAALAAPAPVQVAMSGGPQDLAGLLPDLPGKLAALGGWFRGIGRFASLNGNANAPGVDTQAGGFMAGLDRPFGDHLTAGIAGGWGSTNLSVHDGERGTIETPRLMLYGSYRIGRWAIDATAGYAYDRIDAARPISSTGETASSGHDGQEATGALQASLRLDAHGVTILPAAGLGYVRLFQGGFAESGAPGFDLAVAGRNAQSLRPFAGITAAQSFTTAGGTVLTPQASLRYSHELLNAAPASLVTVGGGSFTVAGLTPPRNELNVGGGVSARLTGRLSLYADYDATLPTGTLFAQAISAGLDYRF